MVNKELQEARQQWFSQELKAMDKDNLQAEIAEKTGYSKQTVNTYVQNHRAISLDFMRTFCEAYGYDFDGVNHMLIDRVKNGIADSTQKADNQSSKTKIDLKDNEQLTNGLDLSSTKPNDDMHRLINAIEKIANANEMLATTNSEVVRELLSYRELKKEKLG